MTRAWGGILPPPRGQGYYPSESMPLPNDPGLPDLREALQLRRLADLIASRRPRPNHAQTIPDYHASLAVHSLADGLRELSAEIDPPAQAPREPFDEAAARARLAAGRNLIDDLKGQHHDH